MGQGVVEEYWLVQLQPRKDDMAPKNPDPYGHQKAENERAKQAQKPVDDSEIRNQLRKIEVYINNAGYSPEHKKGRR